MSAPRVKSPRAFFLSFFLPVLSLVRPRRRLSPAPTAYCRRPVRADAVKAGRSSAATPSGGLAFTAIEHDGRLDGSGRLRSCCLFYPVFVSARVIPIADVFWQALLRSPWPRAIIASTYIRQLRSGLPRCCLHGRSRRRDGTHLSDGRSASCRSAMPTYSHTSDLPDTPDRKLSSPFGDRLIRPSAAAVDTKKIGCLPIISTWPSFRASVNSAIGSVLCGRLQITTDTGLCLISSATIVPADRSQENTRHKVVPLSQAPCRCRSACSAQAHDQSVARTRAKDGG